MSVYAKEYGYFFNSNNNDRTYNAESFETWLKPFFVSGVFAGCLQVKAQTTPDMTIEVLSGYANLDGKPAYWPDDNTLTLEAASGVYDRIDTIVLRRDNTNRRISIEVVKGTASANPQPTAPARTSDLFELVLAEILVGTGVTEITQSVITDKRPDTDVCGYVVATVETPDFSELYAQFTAQAEEFMGDQAADFLTWFDEMKDQLSEDAAGHLQLEIDALSDQMGNVPEGEDLQSEIETAADEVGRISDAMTYVVNGNKSIETVSIPEGAYFRLANSEIVGRSDGLYTAKAAIPVDTVIDSSYFNEASPIAGGVANALNSNIATVDNKVVALSRHTRKTDFSLSDLQAAVAEQNLAKYGLKPGDQKTINGHTYVIAGLNAMRGTDAHTCTSNHVGLIVIPHTTCKWNASGKTYTGANNRGAGYKNCDLQYYLANDVMQMVNTDLGSGHVYRHKKLFGNAINQSGYNRFGTNSGCTSGWEWVDAYISALTEAQVFGGDHWSSSGYDTGEANTLLPVFAEYKHTEIFGNEYPWLRNVSSASQACFASYAGYAGGADGVSAAYCVAGLILYH